MAFLNRTSETCKVRTESDSVSLMPELSSVAICLVKSIIWVLPTLVKIENSAALPSAPEPTSAIDDGWTLRTLSCFRAEYGLSAVIVPLTFLPSVAIAI